MRLDNVEDMPFDHTHWITNQDEINQVLSYNKWDVHSTDKFLDIALGNTDHPVYKGKNKIELRQSIGKKYKLQCLNWNDIKIGTELILKLYCQKFKKDPNVVRKLRSPRQLIEIKDCIPKWCKFESKEFNQLVQFFNNAKIYNGVTKNVLSKSIVYHGVKIDYGTGGAHSCNKSGVYDTDDKWMILDLDIDSLYPSLAISQGLYPEHLGNGFLNIYDGEIVSVRLSEKRKPKKERDFVIVEGFKLSANGFYGKTNSDDSFAYDPLYTMKTTISGQILISMWVERLVTSSPSLQIIQVNTDGVTIRVLREDYQKCIDSTEQLMLETGMSYEANEYTKMVVMDVNNYISQYTDEKCKYKGLFEIDKELHKDPSMRIIPIALSNYFIKGISVSDTILNHKNIYDFCLRLKTNKGWEAQYHYYDDGVKVKTLSKNTRYYISKHGGALYKKNIDDGRMSGVNVGEVVIVFNKYIEKEMSEYDINYQFYIKECLKIINQIEDKQLTLF